MARIRRDVAKLGDGWNDTLLWYAKAVRELDTRAIDDRTSWRFLGAMHGFNETAWRASDLFRPGEATPADLTNNTFGDQCQHGTWYFLPWHRGYLAAFEAIVAAAVKKLQGPDDWALPYWNYFDAQNPNARRIPAPFLDPVLPDDGKPNPLSQPPRRDTTVLEPFGSVPDISLMAMNEPDFLVGGDGTIGFGGGVTSFSRSGARAGDLERNPHNPVHVMIGGFDGGFMSDPNFAGLDPLFWLHHCNIDRLWEAWMNAPGRTMVRDPRWLQGPVPRRFVMPDPAGVARTFIPRDTLKGGSRHPTYDDLSSGTGLAAAPPGPGAVVMDMGSRRQQSVDVLGASHDSVRVGAEPVTAAVPLDPGPAADSVRAMGAIAVGRDVDRLYLQLENITGTAPSAVLDVFVNVPGQDPPPDRAAYRADTLYLFGLDKASDQDGPHAGAGLGFSIDITDLAQRLGDAGRFDPERLEVSLVPVGGSSDARPVTVGRVSILRRRVRAEA